MIEQMSFNWTLIPVARARVGMLCQLPWGDEPEPRPDTPFRRVAGISRNGDGLTEVWYTGDTIMSVLGADGSRPAGQPVTYDDNGLLFLVDPRWDPRPTFVEEVQDILDIFEYEYCYVCGGDTDRHLIVVGPFGEPHLFCMDGEHEQLPGAP